MSHLIELITDHFDRFVEVTKKHSDYVLYKDMKKAIDIIYKIYPMLLVVAHNYEEHSLFCLEVDIVVDVFIELFPSLYRASRDGVVDFGPHNYIEELEEYRDYLWEIIEETEWKQLRQFIDVLDKRRRAPRRWSYSWSKKYVPVLRLANNILYEDWLPE